MQKIEKYIGILLLLGAVMFNLWVYRLEPTSRVDPNDNTFQYALVDRTNQMWSYAQSSCGGITKPWCMVSLLSDHWVPNWAQGYNLPYYYGHVPQMVIVASFRLFSYFVPQLSLFAYYHWVIYLLLALFPISVFSALSIVGMAPVSAGIGALLSAQLSTDGLYGLDPSSFLWRGYGLSSQLFSMIWLPIAVALAYRLISADYAKGWKRSVPAILALSATTSSHLGIGIIAFLSIGILTIARPLFLLLHVTDDDNRAGAADLWAALLENAWKVIPLFAGTLLLLGYWILPILTDGNYHNISFWDGIWKFNSFGYRVVLNNLLNGDLFDFGRLPILTVLVGIGLFSALRGKISDGERDTEHPYFPFALLFVFWLLMYFGRTTWGGLIDLIPGMSEFHISRFIVGVQLAGLFLIPIGIETLRHLLDTLLKRFVPPTDAQAGMRYLLLEYFLLVVMLVSAVFPQTMRFATYNDFLIKRGNTDFTKADPDASALVATLQKKIAERPGRVFAGRGGSWGKGFHISETPMYMYLSNFGIPVILWLPETWSPNSDTEQYFSDDNPAHYSLYNVRYVATPADLPEDQIQTFWKPVASGKTWKIYEVVPAAGYISSGIRPAIVSASKTDYRTLVRLWMHSKYPGMGLYPEITFDPSYPKTTGLPNFRMMDEVTYRVPDRSVHNVFSDIPVYIGPSGKDIASDTLLSVNSESVENDMVFRASVDVKPDCVGCIVVLRQSFHPSWTATVDGIPVRTFSVFPFFTAVSIEQPGSHEIVFSYRPSGVKQLLQIVGIFTFVWLIWLVHPFSLPKTKAKS